ncbi:amino acid ABC transporter permease [Aureimonas frigidaquae]|uniref:Amino acid ABC transporter, permease protein n=1 Tax=Aureimonas frigidaquae TaxID=424757 RepID=A0A0P0Z245_9HYPH|nr:amino acid ABC transporter permease [Aureimonas frigidaquae]BAT28030.1 amino acid ABC transporter, permease protein [Aureimonas frigidaquae]
MGYEMNFGPVLARAPELWAGTLDTIVLSVQSISIGLLVGLVIALMRVDGPRWAGLLGKVYVEAFRNTPLLVQLFLIFFGLPYIGLRLGANEAAIFAISLNLGAYSAEIFRAGLLAIPKTQVEAGLALGLSRLQVMRYVVIVPALRIIYPALTGQLTLTLLGTSIASAISATELTLVGSQIESQTFRSLETFLVIAAIYITVTFAFRLIYWLIGLWLFRRKVPKGGSLTSAVTLTGRAKA